MQFTTPALALTLKVHDLGLDLGTHDSINIPAVVDCECTNFVVIGAGYQEHELELVSKYVSSVV